MKILHKITKELISEIDSLSDINLSGANLSYANLSGADLSGADLWKADLFGANLSGANLSGADLWKADLSGANLSGADLRKADLSGADLPNTDKILSCPWSICHIQHDQIRIGCEYHTTEEWKNFTDEQIINMDKNKALSWWRENKEIVLFIASKCEPYPEK